MLSARDRSRTLDATCQTPKRRKLKEVDSDCMKDPAPKARGRPRKQIPDVPKGNTIAAAAVAQRKTIPVPEANLADIPREKELEAEFGGVLNSLGVLKSDERRQLLLLLGRWPERVDEVAELWKFFGGGASRTFLNLEVWGPPGVGKRAVLRDIIESLGIQHIWIACNLFFSIGDLHARVAEMLQRMADNNLASASGEIEPRQGETVLRARAPLRAIDKVEQAVTGALARIANAGGSSRPGRVIVVFDKAGQLIERLGPRALDVMLALPEVLARSRELAVVTLSHLPFNRGGKDYVPEVVFGQYTKAELEIILERMLCESGFPALKEYEPLPASLLVATCAPHNHDLRVLRNIGVELRRNRSSLATPEDVQRSIQRQLEQHICMGDLEGFGSLVAGSYDRFLSEDPALAATVRLLTKAEKRLVVAAYLSGHVPVEDDENIFLPRGRRGRGRRRKQRRAAEELQIVARPPKVVPLTRVLAVYHALARKSMLISGDLLQHVCRLQKVGLIRFVGDRCCLEQDPKVTCRAHLDLVKAFASDLNIQLADYLADYT